MADEEMVKAMVVSRELTDRGKIHPTSPLVDWFRKTKARLDLIQTGLGGPQRDGRLTVSLAL